MFVLFNVLILIVLGVIGGVIKMPGVLDGLYNLAVLLPSIAVAIRRMHDVGKSGWFCLIPIYNIVLACTEGQKGDNQYGPDPKAGEAPAA